MNRRFNPVTLQQAAQDSPTLASLAARARDASERLQAVQDLIPPEMRAAVQAGPAEGDSWCLLVQRQRRRSQAAPAGAHAAGAAEGPGAGTT